MGIEQQFRDKDLPEEETTLEEVECISLEGFEVVKRGSILHVKRKKEEQEEE